MEVTSETSSTGAIEIKPSRLDLATSAFLAAQCPRARMAVLKRLLKVAESAVLKDEARIEVLGKAIANCQIQVDEVDAAEAAMKSRPTTLMEV